MAPCRGEHLNRGRPTTLEHPRQVADHAPGSFGQSQLDRPAQILDDVTEPTLNRKDHDPHVWRVFSPLPAGLQPGGRLAALGARSGRQPRAGSERDDVCPHLWKSFSQVWTSCWDGLVDAL